MVESEISDVIFLPWSIHAQLESGAANDDGAVGEAALMALASLIFETAHWLFEK